MATAGKSVRAEDTFHFGPVRYTTRDTSTEQKVLEKKIQKLSALREQLKLGKGQKSPRSTSRVRAEVRLIENQTIVI